MSAAAEGSLTLHGAEPRFEAGLRDLGQGIYAWLQPNGVLGESNAGLVVGAGESLLVDTLWDLNVTGAMLAGFEEATAEAPIRYLVNTHSDGDHWWGNQLVHGAETIASRATAERMAEESPANVGSMRRLVRLMSLASRQPLPLPRKSRMRAAATYFKRGFAPFDFAGIELAPPTQTFEGSHSLEVGGRTVELIEVGPAHTEGDTIVHVPDAGAVFTADLLFVGVTPLIWTGPVSNWIAGLDRVLELGAETIVPGHGPPTDPSAVREARAYWEYLPAAAGERFEAGLDAADAAREILASPEFQGTPFAGWDGRERTAINVAVIYRELEGKSGRVSDRERIRLLISMAELAAELQQGA